MNRSRPASGERYLVCAGFAAQPSTASGCRFTDSLRAKVKATQAIRALDAGPGVSHKSHDSREVTLEKTHCSAEWPGDDCGEAGAARGGAHVGGGDCDVAIISQVGVALGVEAEMKQDASFMSYLR